MDFFVFPAGGFSLEALRLLLIEKLIEVFTNIIPPDVSGLVGMIKLLNEWVAHLLISHNSFHH